MIETIAFLRGGPGDGRVMAVRDLRDILMEQLAEDPRAFWSDLLLPIPTKRYRYAPVRIVAEFTVAGIS